MNILLVNDDGIASQGIQMLARALDKEHRVKVVAPHEERSGGSHCITLHEKMYLTPYETKDFSGEMYVCDGTPADCTRVGLIYYAGSGPCYLRDQQRI